MSSKRDLVPRSALLRTSLTELTRRRSRTFFTVATLALAVTSIGLFALPNLMDRTMHAAVLSDRLPDLTVYTEALPPDPGLVQRLAAVPNVRAVEASAGYTGELVNGNRRAVVWVRGVPDFSRQTVDVVHVTAGSAPRDGQVLVDGRDAAQGMLSAGTGDTVDVIGANGVVQPLHVSGTAQNLAGGQEVVSNDVIVLYAPLGTVASLAGGTVYTTFAFRLGDTRPAPSAATLAQIRRTLAATAGFRGFSALPDVRAAGDWPGRSSYTSLAKFFYVVTALALLAALVLIASTMTTLVSEQTGEIGIMKAVGGRRRQVAGVYLRTALLLGAIGTVAGVVLGLVIANLLTRWFGSHFYGVSAGIGAAPLVVLASAAVGLLGPPLAALPAIRRATRVPLRDALEANGSAVGGIDAGDRLLRRVRFLPRPAQIGLRNVGRRRRRAVSTAVVVALAVGTLLALVGFGSGVADTSRASWHDHGEDFEIDPQGQPLGTFAAGLIRATPGVAAVEPKFVTDVSLAGHDARIWAIRPKTMFRVHIADGRWLSATENARRARVAVVERDIARTTGTHLGDTIQVDLASGPVPFRVVGISSNQQENGTALYVPLATMHALIPAIPADASDYWVRTTSHDAAFVDRTTTRVEETLNANGYVVSAQIVHVMLADEVASNRTLVTSVLVLGLLIVAIGMAGLANTLALSVLERTREIGILRTIGARARDVRRIFATEVIVLAVLGWLVAIPTGLLLDVLLVWMTREIVKVEVPLTFSLWNVAIALVGTIVLALLITLVPIRSAARLQPGEALRYA